MAFALIDTSTNLFYAPQKQWVKNPEKAQKFNKLQTASNFKKMNYQAPADFGKTISRV